MRYVNVCLVLCAVLALGVTVAPATAQDAAKPKVMSHDAAGRDNCLMCHSGAMEAVPKIPDTHADRSNETCKWCHAPDSDMQTATPKVIAHDLEGRDNCMMCHKAGAMEPVPDAPASHEGRDNKWCLMCHVTGG